MNDMRPFSLSQRNPVTNRKHRKEVFWQVTIPLVIAVAFFLALGAFASLVGGGATTSKIADVALIWLIVPVMAIGLVFLVLLGAFVFGVIWLIHHVPVYTRKAQALVVSASMAIKNLTDAMVEPFLRAQSFFAALRAFRRK